MVGQVFAPAKPAFPPSMVVSTDSVSRGNFGDD
jgi:hypothetical protein